MSKWVHIDRVSHWQPTWSGACKSCNYNNYVISVVIVKLLLYNRELWREEAAIEQSMQNTREELGKTERNLRSTVSKVCIFEHLILHVHCAVFWPSYFCLNCQFFMMHDCESSVRNNLSWSYSVALEIQFVLLHLFFLCVSIVSFNVFKNFCNMHTLRFMIMH